MAISSLILKILDLVVLIIDGDKLECDQLQFGFQSNSSTTMCSWAVSAVVNYYNQAGTPVYGCTMDISKAFDMCEWCTLFNDLRERKVAPIFLRILLFMYSEQKCDVRWNSSYSHRFPISNGVRQGTVSSPILWSCYINKLILKLRSLKIGCKIGEEYYGILVYADDIFLLSANQPGLQAMVSCCEQFATSHNLKFSVNEDPQKSKTKCIVFNKRQIPKDKLMNIYLNGTPLPWQEDVKHLGNILETNNSFTKDCDLKRGKFIGKVHSLFQELHFASPEFVMKMYEIYCSSFYGSNLWKLSGSSCERIYTAWNTACRILFKIPRTSHRYLIEPISQSTHPRVFLSSRFVKYHMTLINSNKSAIRCLANLVKNEEW